MLILKAECRVVVLGLYRYSKMGSLFCLSFHRNMEIMNLPFENIQLLFFPPFPLSKFPPSLYAPEILEAHQDEISRVFLVALDPLITQLLPFSPFMEQVLSENLGGLKVKLYNQCCLRDQH